MASALALAAVTALPSLSTAAQPPIRIGSEFQVNTYTAQEQQNVDVGSEDNGDFVIVWHSANDQDDDEYGVFGRRFTSSGLALASEFQINTFVTGVQGYPAIASTMTVTSWWYGPTASKSQPGVSSRNGSAPPAKLEPPSSTSTRTSPKARRAGGGDRRRRRFRRDLDQLRTGWRQLGGFRPQVRFLGERAGCGVSGQQLHHGLSAQRRRRDGRGW
jgi:hypothetical protein